MTTQDTPMEATMTMAEAAILLAKAGDMATPAATGLATSVMMGRFAVIRYEDGSVAVRDWSVSEVDNECYRELKTDAEREAADDIIDNPKADYDSYPDFAMLIAGEVVAIP